MNRRRYDESDDPKPDGRSFQQPSASPAPTPCAIASACSRPPRPCSAPAGRRRAWRRWRGTAGVGIGTLYRHFPTREALFEAVYRREVEQLGELAEQLGRCRPVEALRRWVRANVEFVATKKGMAAALALAAQGPRNSPPIRSTG